MVFDMINNLLIRWFGSFLTVFLLKTKGLLLQALRTVQRNNFAVAWDGWECCSLNSEYFFDIGQVEVVIVGIDYNYCIFFAHWKLKSD